MARLRQLVETSPYFNVKDPPELQLRHDMMRAKLSGYIDKPAVVFNRYPPTDTDAAGALCAGHRRASSKAAPARSKTHSPSRCADP